MMQDPLNYLKAFNRCRIAVIGDLMLDEYLYGVIERSRPEATLPILNRRGRESTLVGRNVVENPPELGVQVAGRLRCR